MRTLSKKIMLLMSLFMASTAFTACSSDDDDVSDDIQNIDGASYGGTNGKCLCPAFSEADGLFGYINEKGQMVIAPQFSEAKEFDASTGLAQVYKDGNECFIDSLGNIKNSSANFGYLSDPSYRGEPFFNGFAVAINNFKDMQRGLINTNFEYIIQPKYMDIRLMYTDRQNPSYVSPDGLVICSNTNNKYGCINTKGETVLDFKYDDLGSISEDGLIACGTDVDRPGWSARSIQYRYIDKTGKTVIDSKYYDALEFHDGVALVNTSNAFDQSKNGSWGLINERGTEVVWPRYSHLSYIADNRYKFLDGLYGIMDASGKEIVPATYINIGDFTDGIAVATDKYNTQGYIDVNGNVVIEFIYKEATDFQNGYAGVTDVNNLSYIIDKSGNIIVMLEKGYNLIYAHKNGLFYITKFFDDGIQNKYVNLLGETVYSWTSPY